MYQKLIRNLIVLYIHITDQSLTTRLAYFEFSNEITSPFFSLQRNLQKIKATTLDENCCHLPEKPCKT